MYRSSSFRLALGEIARISPDRAVVCLDALLEANAIPRRQESSADGMVCSDAAFLLASPGTRHEDASSIFAESKRLLRMEFQCEYGPAATGDRKGRREDLQPPEKDFFGTQLAKALYDAWSAGSGEPGLSQAVAVTVGRDHGQPDLYGLIHHQPPNNDTSFLYSTTDLFPDLHPGIVSFQNIELNWNEKIFIGPAAMHRLGDLMYDRTDR